MQCPVTAYLCRNVVFVFTTKVFIKTKDLTVGTMLVFCIVSPVITAIPVFVIVDAEGALVFTTDLWRLVVQLLSATTTYGVKKLLFTTTPTFLWSIMDSFSIFHLQKVDINFHFTQPFYQMYVDICKYKTEFFNFLGNLHKNN